MNLNKDRSESMQSPPKNTAQGSFLETAVETGFTVMTYQNETSEVQLLEKEIDSSFIQFHFCVKGSVSLCLIMALIALTFLKKIHYYFTTPKRLTYSFRS